MYIKPNLIDFSYLIRNLKKLDQTLKLLKGLVKRLDISKSRVRVRQRYLLTITMTS